MGFQSSFNSLLGAARSSATVARLAAGSNAQETATPANKTEEPAKEKIKKQSKSSSDKMTRAFRNYEKRLNAIKLSQDTMLERAGLLNQMQYSEGE